VSSVLDGLSRRPFDDFVKFCAALISVEQTDVILDFMSPEIHADGSSSSSSIPATTTTTDAVVAEFPPVARTLPNFNWRAVMRRNFSVLTQKLDPDNGLFERLRSKGVISDWNIDMFKVFVDFVCKLNR